MAKSSEREKKNWGKQKIKKNKLNLNKKSKYWFYIVSIYLYNKRSIINFNSRVYNTTTLYTIDKVVY